MSKNRPTDPPSSVLLLLLRDYEIHTTVYKYTLLDPHLRLLCSREVRFLPSHLPFGGPPMGKRASFLYGPPPIHGQEGRNPEEGTDVFLPGPSCSPALPAYYKTLSARCGIFGKTVPDVTFSPVSSLHFKRRLQNHGPKKCRCNFASCCDDSVAMHPLPGPLRRRRRILSGK